MISALLQSEHPLKLLINSARIAGFTVATGAIALLSNGRAIASTSLPSSSVQQIAQVSEPQTGTPIPSDIRFACQMQDGNYTVMYYPQSQPNQAYPWATPTELGGGWTEERRCNEISRRLESYRPDGLLEMRTSVENGYDIICVTTQQDSDCRIVLTVPPGQDPLVTRDRVFENLLVADRGQSTDAVNTFTGDDSNGILNQIGDALNIDLPSLPRRSRSSTPATIDLRPFLDPADGGTGANL